MEIVWTKQALDDLSNIYQFRENPTAKRHIQKIHREARAIRIFPESAPVYVTPNTKKEFRALTVVKGLYKIVYYIDLNNDNVVIMRIWDCRQDPENFKVK